MEGSLGWRLAAQRPQQQQQQQQHIVTVASVQEYSTPNKKKEACMWR
ncbi:hypothetical protein GQ55_5G441500 [Panicum hallii var. hallii]|uniref:Uncharacterized protein n=1 Tax=Panicum hallii var. hallii TaxID=1504633 RepID=A0A2T7DPP5_9POAL|nr:hypothetical protein GQ55_5G441500 [Panicum hallii var. hallii]